MTADRRADAHAAEAAARRSEVLRHVYALIGACGIDGMTMRQVSRATGLSTGTINYHFTNKRALILAALDAAAASDVPAPPGASPVERLLHVLRGFVLEDDDRRARWRFWVEVTAQGARDAELRERQRSRMEADRREIESLLAEGVEARLLRPELDPALVAEPLLALAYGLAIQQLTSPDAATVRRASDALEGSVRELSVS
jgi:AcrR family transcriptional regulator